jgi:hypothetical protein
VTLDRQADEHGQAQPGAGTADLGVVSGDDPAGFERLDPAQARRRRERDGVREVDVGDPAVLLEPGHDGTIDSVWQMFRHETQHIGDITQSCVAWRAQRGEICHRVRAHFGDS